MKNKSMLRLALSAIVIVIALGTGWCAYLSDPTPRVLIPQISGVIACAGAMLAWNFFCLNIRIFIFFLLLCALYISVPFIRLCIGSPLRTEEFITAFEAASAAFVPLIFFAFTASQAKKMTIRTICNGVVFFLTAVLVLFPGSLWAYFIATKQLLTSDIILAFAQTNSDESTEYFKAHADIYWALAFVFCLVLLALFLRSLKLCRFSECRSFKGRFEYGILLFVLSIYELANVIPSVPYLATSVLKITGSQLEQYARYSQQTDSRAERLSSIGGISCKKGYAGIYMLVIGESANRDHMQIYGYKRSNTPFMYELLKKKNSFMFENSYSSFPQTVPSVTYALTGKNQYNGADLVDSYSILEVARKAGFEIYWLSNQRKIGVYETPISVISSAADHEIWLNNTAKMYSLFHDEQLVNHFPDLLNKKNVLIVVHVMGSHARYEERTPDGVKVYSGSSDKRIDDYDSSILYTDFVISGLYKKIKDLPQFKAMIYFSDHGEDVDTKFDHNPADFTFPMVRIPLFITVSDGYAEQHRSVTQALRSHKKNVWTNDLLYDLMCGLMGLEGMPQYEPRFDLSSPSYRLGKDMAVTMHGDLKVTEDKFFGHYTK